MKKDRHCQGESEGIAAILDDGSAERRYTMDACLRSGAWLAFQGTEQEDSHQAQLHGPTKANRL